MKLSTINQVVMSILEGEDHPGLVYHDKERVANEAAIYLTTALMAEQEGIDKAMEYFFGSHSDQEYVGYMTEVVAPEDVE